MVESFVCVERVREKERVFSFVRVKRPVYIAKLKRAHMWTARKLYKPKQTRCLLYEKKYQNLENKMDLIKNLQQQKKQQTEKLMLNVWIDCVF